MPIEGFALDILNAVGHLGNDGNGGEMLKQLVGQGKGKIAHIMGNGPSLTRMWPRGVAGVDNALSIAMNNALAWMPGSDIWLISESQVHRRAPWFYDHTEYAGLTIWDASMVLNGLLEDNAARKEAGQTHYSDEFLGNVVWFLRGGLDGATTGPPEAFRSFDDGLFGYLPMAEVDGPEMAGRYEHGELTGSAAMQAIHLAAGMGCDNVHLYGVELSWQDGEPQHADGLDTFHPDGEPVNRPFVYRSGVNIGRQSVSERWTTLYFADSADAIRWYCRNAAITLHDHSGGLLSE